MTTSPTASAFAAFSTRSPFTRTKPSLDQLRRQAAGLGEAGVTRATCRAAAGPRASPDTTPGGPKSSALVGVRLSSCGLQGEQLGEGRVRIRRLLAPLRAAILALRQGDAPGAAPCRCSRGAPGRGRRAAHPGARRICPGHDRGADPAAASRPPGVPGAAAGPGEARCRRRHRGAAPAPLVRPATGVARSRLAVVVPVKAPDLDQDRLRRLPGRRLGGGSGSAGSTGPTAARRASAGAASAVSTASTGLEPSGNRLVARERHSGLGQELGRMGMVGASGFKPLRLQSRRHRARSWSRPPLPGPEARPRPRMLRPQGALRRLDGCPGAGSDVAAASASAGSGPGGAAAGAAGWSSGTVIAGPARRSAA